MLYRTLGKTGLKVSVVGFGGIPIQRIDSKQAREVISRAYDKGMNFIDTARAYTVSEQFIGDALEGSRNNWIIASKSMARDQKAMDNDVETSLRNLKTDYIDLYQIHNIKTMNDYNLAFNENGAYNALTKAKQAGKIGFIGVTAHSLDMLAYMIENVEIDTIMFPYNIIETQATELFKEAASKNIGVIAMKPMAGGALEDGNLALRFILRNQDISIAIPGMASIKEVDINAAVVQALSTFDELLPLSLDENERIAAIRMELGNSFCRRCGYCAPCPQGIDIPSMFLFDGYKKRYNLTEWAESRYFSNKITAKDCIKCGKCEVKCPYNLPIRKMLEEVKKNFGE